MKKTIFSASALIAACLLGASAANAHHSLAASYKEGEDIAVEGEVSSFSFKNPHVLIFVDVTAADGTVTNWMSEGAAANSMRSQGWARDSFKAGDRVRIHGNPTHDGSPMVSIKRVDILDPDSGEVVRTLGDNREPTAALEIVQIPLTLADGRPNLSGTWLQIRDPERERPEDLGGIPPYNEVGAAAQAVYDRSDDPQIFCEPPGLVRQAGFTPHPVRITQNDDNVIFEYEEYGGRRVVPLGDELPPPGEKSHLGDSVAHYQGNTLIVDTVNLLRNPGHPHGHQSSDRATTRETYVRADEEQFGPVLSASMEVTDPVFYDGGSWVLKQTRRYAEGYEFIENNCRPPLRQRKIDAATTMAKVVIPPPEPPPGPEEEKGPGILERLETSGPAVWVTESLYGYPIALGLHAISLALVLGLLVFVDLRVLNVIGDIRLSAMLGPMKLAWFGFAVNALSGFVLFSSQATSMINSPPFLIKIGLLLLAAIIAFYMQRQISKNVNEWNAGAVPSSIKAAAAISLLCWTGAIIAAV